MIDFEEIGEEEIGAERADFNFVPDWIHGPNPQERWIWYGPLGTGSPGRFQVFLTNARTDMPRIVRTINELRQAAYRTRRTSTPPVEVKLPAWLSGPNPGEAWDMSSGGQFRDACWRARGNPPNPDDQMAIGTTEQGVPHYIKLLNDAQRFMEDNAPEPDAPPPPPPPDATPEPVAAPAEAAPAPAPAEADYAPAPAPRAYRARVRRGADDQADDQAEVDQAEVDQADDQADDQAEPVDFTDPREDDETVSGNPFEHTGRWTVQSSHTTDGWRGALVIPSGAGQVTLTATVTPDLARRLGATLRAAFKAEHDRLHHVAGMEIIGALAAEVGVPWWQNILPGLTAAASAIPGVGPFVAPFAQMAQSAFGRPPQAPQGGGWAPQLPQLPGLSALAQGGPGPRTLEDIPGAAGGLLAAAQAANGVLGPIFGGAGILAQGTQLVSGNPENFGRGAVELCSLLERALRILDCHAAAHSADPELAGRAMRALSVPPATAAHAAARGVVDAMIPQALHVGAAQVRRGPATGRVGPRPAARPAARPAGSVSTLRAPLLWKAAALAALQRGDKAHAMAILRGA